MIARAVPRRLLAVVAFLCLWIAAITSPALAQDTAPKDGRFVFERLCPEKNIQNNGDPGAKGEPFDHYRICMALMRAPGRGTVDDVVFLRSRVVDLRDNTAVAAGQAEAKLQASGLITALLGIGAAAMALFKKDVFGRVRTFLLALAVIVPPFVVSMGWKSQWQAELAASQSFSMLRDRIDMALVARAATGDAIDAEVVAAWLTKFEATREAYSATVGNGLAIFAPESLLGAASPAPATVIGPVPATVPGENRRSNEDQQRDPSGRGGNPPGSENAG